jgi:uncharacterized membrane protein YeaQ/YmgE (transglycosylase-associated protein family)
MVMSTFAEVAVHPGGIVGWLVVGLGVGCLAGLMKKGGYGIGIDVIVGLVGALIGGFVFGVIDTGEVALWGMAVAFLGACILITIVRIAARGLSQV